MAALSVAGLSSATSELLGSSVKQGNEGKNRIRIKGIYYRMQGLKCVLHILEDLEAEKRKVEFGKQLNVLGAVGGIDPRMVSLPNAKPWEYDAVSAVKNAWDKAGLKLEVIEGPPALSEKTKLALEGRDEEISNFILFMKNLSRAGDRNHMLQLDACDQLGTDNNRPSRSWRSTGHCV